ncbi:MAG TPA: regulatory protein RecX [Xanthomonadales bacterium]|nr:regulatory protein RecX [Xanthomonadales bacterium]
MNPDPGEEPQSESRQDHPEVSKSKMMAYAGRLLGRREYAVRELESRLLRKWPKVEQIEQRVSELIQTLQSDGALSDERFAESFIRSRRRRYQGPVKVRAELRQRQVPDSVIEQNLMVFEDEWTTLAATWLSQQSHEPLDFHGRARYYRRLVNRGFTHQQAMDALSKHSKTQT